MTYCVAVAVEAGLVFVSDSRTNAGVDQVATYSKMHFFGRDGDRQLVLLSSGNLATTQAVLAQIKRDVNEGESTSLMTVDGVGDAADYLGTVLLEQHQRHGAAVAAAGFTADASFIIGGQVGSRTPKVYLVYPQGNYITTSEHTPFLQIGEAKYGKPVLDRVIRPELSLEEVARCALVSMDSTMRSNATVGPPIEVCAYRRDSLRLLDYRKLDEDDVYLVELRRTWGESIVRAFEALPEITWDPPPDR